MITSPSPVRLRQIMYCIPVLVGNGNFYNTQLFSIGITLTNYGLC